VTETGRNQPGGGEPHQHKRHHDHDHDEPAPSVDEYAARIRSLVTFAGEETVPLAESLGRVLVGNAISPVDLPLFRNSQMDGFAVRAADAPGPLPIVGEVAARPGEPEPLEPGTAVRIMTGAVVPEGADAIVPVESASVEASTVTLPADVPAGAFVRERGSDLTAGTVLVPADTRLASRHIGALAAAGIREVRVRRRPRIAVITSGAELSEVPSRLGEIHDANAPALVAAITAAGGELSLVARVSDEVDALEPVLAAAVAASDVVVTSGGISMGDYEVVREALIPRGGWFGHVAMQPGGPQGLSLVDGVPVLSFPGNPVSTQLSFEVFLAPLLREWSGLPAMRRQQREITDAARSPRGKRQFLRGRWLGGNRVELASGPGSHLVAGLAAADALIVVPEDVVELRPGDTVETWEL
jgi:molybdopterin molybdotransferase